MIADTKLIEYTKNMLIAKFPRFGAEIAKANIEFSSNLKYRTAATDGKNIYIDPDYLASLSDNDKLFLIAHEIMHIKFEHMFRLYDKNGKQRDLDLWNIATDAIINANLERDGLNIMDGYVDMPGALKYTSEEIYDILYNLKKDKKTATVPDDLMVVGFGDYFGEDSLKRRDDHTQWQEAFEKCKQNNFAVAHNDEKCEFEDNRKERREIAKQKFQQKQKDFNNGVLKEDRNPYNSAYKNKEYEIDWKYLLKKEIEKTVQIWSQRRSVAENNYAYRMTDFNKCENSETEIMLDSSGSISKELLKDFLHEVKKILKSSKIRVGVFSSNFYGWVDIKTEADIDKLKIPGGGATNFDAASRAFTKKREVNKICFTDGEDYGDAGIQDKRNDIIWLTFKNKDFKPDYGKVIYVEESKIAHYKENSDDVQKGK